MTIRQTAGRDALGKFAPEFAHYNDDILFGENWNKEAVGNSVKEKHASEMVFPIGAPNDGFSQYFIGQSYLAPISTSQVGIFNVTFEPGCRNNWHVHRADKGGGQILICIAGRGFYQEWGKAAIEMHPGDCVNIPANIKHWHGAASDSWFSHLAIEVPGENGSNEWMEPVDDVQYAVAGNEIKIENGGNEL